MHMLAASVEVVIGVDTHKHTHTAAVVAAATGQARANLTVPATPDGYRQLLELADQHHGQRVWAIEGTGGYGAGLTRSLAAHTEQVVDMDRPRRATRRHGAKSDPLDPPAGGRLRPVAHPGQLGGGDRHHGRDLAELGPSDPGPDRRAADHRQAILVLVRAWRPDLLTRTGVGPIVAATVLCAWSHAGRCRTDAAFAMLGGAAPIPASSGQTIRVRLNRSGDRQLNQALYTVVLTRLRTDPATRAYAARRRAQGKTNREIKRCLVRYVARQLYRLLATQPALDAT
jgi:transposase